MKKEVCSFCGADLTMRAEGESCNKCLNYDERWETHIWNNDMCEFIEK